MLAQRTLQQSLRRYALHPTGLSQNVVSRSAAPAIIAATSQRRCAATSNVNQAEGYDILVKQRLQRPVSPHLGIYQPQITWYLSILNRITGCVLSGGFYVFGFGYLIAPVFGWHLESTTMAAAFGSLSLAAKIPLKLLVAFPFTFHSFNGIRHLVWDTGRELKNKQVNRTGWIVVATSVASAAYLAIAY